MSLQNRNSKVFETLHRVRSIQKLKEEDVKSQYSEKVKQNNRRLRSIYKIEHQKWVNFKDERKALFEYHKDRQADGNMR